MIQDATKPQYSAVICRRCSEPIPVPGIVLRMEGLAGTTDDAEAFQPERVFSVRCRVCECEHLYRSGQIVQVEGEPKSRRGLSNTIYRHGALSRAAGA